MKLRLIIPLVLSILTLIPTLAYAEEASEGSEKSLSPYFLVNGEDSLDSFPLKSTSAEVSIVGVIADVTVRQEYQNLGKMPIEAIYVFPGSTRAAVHGMSMTIGERLIQAKVKERSAAKATYEKARAEGKSSSLLEQHRPNVFQMNVANIMPGESVNVELKYTELLVPTDGVYEFVYPTVVGPRYSALTESSVPLTERWVANPYLKEGSVSPTAFALNAKISTGIPLQDLVSPSHEIDVNYDGKNTAELHISPKEHSGGSDRDFKLRFRLEGEKIQSGLLLSEGPGEKFFLLMMEPPQRVTAAQIPPREYIFVVDVSGSMIGFPLDVSKQLLVHLLNSLRSEDRFNILLFSGGNRVYSPSGSLPATGDEIPKAVNFIFQEQGGGGTQLLPALHTALSLPKEEGMARSVVVITDGYVDCESQAFDLISENLNQSNLFAFGIGSSVNRHLIEGLARAGLGEPFIVTNPREADEIAKKFQNYISSPVLTGTHYAFNNFEAYDVQPSKLPDLFADRPVVFFGKWRGDKGGSVSIQGYTGGDTQFVQSIDISRAKTVSSDALRYLWARSKISSLSDYARLRDGRENDNLITELGLTYNLLTKNTSFVAVDEVVRNVDGTPKNITQPLQLPQGVSDMAVGFDVGTSPEPETWALIGVTLLFIASAFLKRQRVVG